MSVFDLGRMRHLDLLALWHELHPDSHLRDGLVIGAMTKDRLAATILASPA